MSALEEAVTRGKSLRQFLDEIAGEFVGGGFIRYVVIDGAQQIFARLDPELEAMFAS